MEIEKKKDLIPLTATEIQQWSFPVKKLLQTIGFFLQITNSRLIHF